VAGGGRVRQEHKPQPGGGRAWPAGRKARPQQGRNLGYGTLADGEEAGQHMDGDARREPKAGISGRGGPSQEAITGRRRLGPW